MGLYKGGSGMILKTITIKMYLGFSDVVEVIDQKIKENIDLKDIDVIDRKQFVYIEKFRNRNVYMIESEVSSIYQKILKHEKNVRNAYKYKRNYDEFVKITEYNHSIRQEIQALVHSKIGESWKVVGFDVNEQFAKIKIKRIW